MSTLPPTPAMFGLWTPCDVWVTEPVGEGREGTTADVVSDDFPGATSVWEPYLMWTSRLTPLIFGLWASSEVWTVEGAAVRRCGPAEGVMDFAPAADARGILLSM